MMATWNLQVIESWLRGFGYSLDQSSTPQAAIISNQLTQALKSGLAQPRMLQVRPAIPAQPSPRNLLFFPLMQGVWLFWRAGKQLRYDQTMFFCKLRGASLTQDYLLVITDAVVKVRERITA